MPAEIRGSRPHARCGCGCRSSYRELVAKAARLWVEHQRRDRPSDSPTGFHGSPCNYTQHAIRAVGHPLGTRLGVALSLASVEEPRPVNLVLSAKSTSSTHLHLGVSSPNGPLARRWQLERALTDIETGVQKGNNWDASNATKRALEALHELADCLKRGEWTQAGWPPDEQLSWIAHIGARNMAHHSSSSIVTLTRSRPADEQLTWALDGAAVAELSLRSKNQAMAYNARLDGQPVLPPLGRLVAQTKASIPD
jgi:hypothetical protein